MYSNRWSQLVESGGPKAYGMSFNSQDELEFNLTEEAAAQVLDHVASVIMHRHLRHLSKLPFVRPPAAVWGFSSKARWEAVPGGARVIFPYPEADLTRWEPWKKTSHALLSNIQLVVEALSFFTPNKCDGEQFIHIKSISNEVPDYLGAFVSAPAGKIMKTFPEGEDEDVSGAMRRAYRKFSRQNMHHLDRDIHMVHSGRGIPHFKAGGSCACLGLNGHGYDHQYDGFELADHNLDNPAFTLIILAGLAQLDEKIRRFKK